ncbi:MAG: hypothetical protein AAGJ40_09765 [Planctomycetota bacterium]
MAERDRANELLAAAERRVDAGPPSRERQRRYEPYGRQPRPSIMPFMMLVMFMMMTAMGGFIAWQHFKSPAQVPVTPVVVPAGNVDALVAPITAKLSYEPAKAEAVRKAFRGYSEALKGASGARITDSRVLNTVNQAFATDLGLSGGVSVGNEISAAIAAHLGIEWGSDGPGEESGYEFTTFDESDIAKLVEITGAIARAAEAAL